MLKIGKIVGYDEILGVAKIIAPVSLDEITKLNGSRKCEVRIDDGRMISAKQRKTIYSLIRDIADWSGHDPEVLKSLFKYDFIINTDCCEYFSLSDVDMTTAWEFQQFLIEFCVYHNVPSKELLILKTPDIAKYLYACAINKKCAVCGANAELHHIDKVGMGRNRDEIIHEGLEVISLCRIHHTEAHDKGNEFFEKYHLESGIRATKEICEKYNLRRIKSDRENKESDIDFGRHD